MERVMRTLLKKMLAGAVAFTMLLLNLTCGMMTVLAEQYYGWSDGSSSYPSALYVTPVGDTTRKLDIPVYCFDYKLKEPLTWGGEAGSHPGYLPIYEKYEGLDELLSQEQKMETYYRDKQKIRKVKEIAGSLVAVLGKGYPNNKSELLSTYGLSEQSARKVTQLALWCYTDSVEENTLMARCDDNSKEKEALKFLINVGKNNAKHYSGKNLTFYLYSNPSYDNRFQNLIGADPLTEDPQHGEIIDLTYQSGPMVEEGGHSGGTTEVEDTKKPDVIIGGQGSVTETTENTQEGMAGSTEVQPEVEDTKQPQSDIILGGQGNVIDTTENTQEGMSGQSGNIAETEDTKQPQSDIILGGQGNVIETTEDTQAGMSGTNDIQTFEEDTGPKLEFHFDNELPNDAPKPEQPEQPKAPQQDQPHLLRSIESNQALPKAHEAKDILALVGVGILSMLGLVFWFRPYQKD
ncbi:TPA: fibronectin binding protein [Streptococcus equi subsp. zooepidemicus]|nr:fibronectin binding protein [Streptococcus equi subsp. zooepidemicus]HEL1011173.1 fibronectin binding protein [Streptococcus equi subsp. ruminatorum]HEL1023361.1 fibronectin binding protein [Streptococcus equi subsp. ruminatorum CECT 5772]